MEKKFELVGYYDGSLLVKKTSLSPAEAGKLSRFYYSKLGVIYAVQNGLCLADEDWTFMPQATVTFSPDGHEVRFGTPEGAHCAAAVYVREQA